MKLLLDSHVWLWWLAADPGLSAGASAAIADRRNQVYVSAATIWELAIKRGLGKLTTPDAFQVALAASGFMELPIHARHGELAGNLPPHHKDPFDRMLVAQAQLDQLTIVTRDPLIERYGVETLFA